MVKPRGLVRVSSSKRGRRVGYASRRPNIAPVRTWKIATDNGDYLVDAPTRILAVLSFRRDYGNCARIQKVGNYRPRK